MFTKKEKEVADKFYKKIEVPENETEEIKIEVAFEKHLESKIVKTLLIG